MKLVMCGAAVLAFALSASVQAADQETAATQPPRSPGHSKPQSTCTSQHLEQPDLSASDLLSRNFDIKAAVPGGIWLQKKNEVFYCNSGIVKDGDTMCWKLRAPVKGQNCEDAIGKVKARDIRG